MGGPVKHYKFGGSTAARTLACPAWVGLSENIPKASGAASPAAMTGTMLHEVVERCVNDFDYDAMSDVGKTIEGVELTEEHITEKIRPAIGAVEALEHRYGLEFQTEVTMAVNDEIGGTADLVGWSAERNIFIVGDHKFGDGYLIDAEENKQGLFYAALAKTHFVNNFDFNDETVFIFAIIQPSHRKDEVLDTWEFSTERLEQFQQTFSASVRLAEGSGLAPTPNAGSHCTWCPAEAVCPQKTGEAHRALRLPTEGMELEALNQAIGMVAELESWTKAVKKLAHEQAEAGVPIDGFKLVAKRASRVWNDPKAMEIKLKNANKFKAEDYYEQKLKSPPQIEKVCKQKGIDFGKFSGSISAVSSGTTLVSDKDKRPAILPVAALAAMAATIK